ncbi:hypothetical protein BCD67_00575 [Oscillatoriales cyanobacterium USR001]|nr:hypothetical protein BCD67_00575 [Oscillatoriales cyanobacterium USR001]
MKAKINDEIRTVTNIQSTWDDRVFPKGMIGIIVECYQSPEEGYAVDLVIPDPTLVGEFDYENIILKSEQFEVITSANLEKEGQIEGLLVAN